MFTVGGNPGPGLGTTGFTWQNRAVHQVYWVACTGAGISIHFLEQGNLADR